MTANDSGIMGVDPSRLDRVLSDLSPQDAGLQPKRPRVRSRISAGAGLSCRRRRVGRAGLHKPSRRGARLPDCDSFLSERMNVGPFPDGIVRLVAEDGPRPDIWDLEGLYEALGADGATFGRWLEQFGLTGSSPDGQWLIPTYPMFSKVAWMNIDPVQLTPHEAAELTAECNLALEENPPHAVKVALEGIRSLAGASIAGAVPLEFGHA